MSTTTGGEADEMAAPTRRSSRGRIPKHLGSGMVPNQGTKRRPNRPRKNPPEGDLESRPVAEDANKTPAIQESAEGEVQQLRGGFSGDKGQEGLCAERAGEEPVESALPGNLRSEFKALGKDCSDGASGGVPDDCAVLDGSGTSIREDGVVDTVDTALEESKEGEEAHSAPNFWCTKWLNANFKRLPGRGQATFEMPANYRTSALKVREFRRLSADQQRDKIKRFKVMRPAERKRYEDMVVGTKPKRKSRAKPGPREKRAKQPAKGKRKGLRSQKLMQHVGYSDGLEARAAAAVKAAQQAKKERRRKGDRPSKPGDLESGENCRQLQLLMKEAATYV